MLHHRFFSIRGLAAAAVAIGLIGVTQGGCASDRGDENPDESTESALIQTCLPLVRNTSRDADLICNTRDRLSLEQRIEDFVQFDIGTCGACAFSIGSIIWTGGASLPVVMFTGAGCYGCASGIQTRLQAEGTSCDLSAQLASSCQAACTAAGSQYLFATATMGPSAGDVECQCGTSRDAHVCCTTPQYRLGPNRQSTCDPQQIAGMVAPTNLNCPKNAAGQAVVSGGISQARCGEQAAGNGGSGSYVCDPACNPNTSTTFCVGGGTHWSSAGTASGSCAGQGGSIGGGSIGGGSGGGTNPNGCPSSRSACLGHATCCWADAGFSQGHPGGYCFANGERNTNPQNGFISACTMGNWVQ